jgi:hypothetical protein
MTTTRHRPAPPVRVKAPRLLASFDGSDADWDLSSIAKRLTVLKYHDGHIILDVQNHSRVSRENIILSPTEARALRDLLNERYPA